MELVLIAVTVVSLGLAVAMALVAWTLLRTERQRSAARIEALEALAFSGELDRPEPIAGPKVADTRIRESVAVHSDHRPELPDWDAAIRADAAHQEHRSAGPTPAARARAILPDAMFGTEPASSAGTRRLLAVAAIGLLIAAAYATASAVRSPEVVATDAVSGAQPENAGPQPLELLSLKHAPDRNGTFTVSGFVQNPTSGKNLTNVEAVIYLFDDKNQYFMTGRAALETADMRSGTDSAFQVHIPGALNVGRYRVGFRQADGTVVAHVDRRGQFPEGSSETVLGVDEVRPAGGMR
jgi:hypothetical protein